MHEFHEFNNLSHFLVPTAPWVQMLPTKGRFAWVFGGVYTVLGETTRNPTIKHDGQATRLKCAVAVVERCMSCLVSRSISNLIVYALARRQ